MLNLGTIDLQENERNWEEKYAVELSKTMYTEQHKFETNIIRIVQLITTLISINPVVTQWCYNKENLNHVDRIQIYQLNMTD